MPSRMLPFNHTRRTIGALAALIAFSLSCDSSSGPDSDSEASLTLSSVSASLTSIVADGKTTSQITVQLRDAEGVSLAKSGGVVTMSASRGTLGPVTDQNNGLYVATLTSSVAAGPAVISATLGGAALTNTVTVNFIAGPPAAIAIANAASNNQTAAAGSNVPIPPSVKITDANSNPVQGVSVAFAVATGGGSITAANATTNAEGIAQVGSWTLGTAPGPNSLTATSAGLTGSPVAFTATGTGTGTGTGSLTIASGDGQSAIAGQNVAVAPSVKVADANGAAVSGATVTFAVASGGGSVTGATATTNASGIATVGSWRLGTTAGTNTLTATSGSLPAVTFTATGTVGAAALITINAGNNQTATIGTIIATPPSVRVTDANGNVVAGAGVTFAVASGGGSITGSNATTNASGIATVGSWTLGSSAGPNTLTASLNGVSGQSVTFTATGAASNSLGISVSGKVERNETITVTVTQDGVPLAPGSVTVTLSPAENGTVNGDGTIKLLKAGSLTINAQANTRSGSLTITVGQPPLVVFDLVSNFSRQIWQVAIDGGDLVQLTTAGSDNQHPSRVGSKVVYAGARNGKPFDLFSLNLTNSVETQITNNGFSERDPNLSPNGNRIVYVSSENGLDRAIYANADGSGVGVVDDISNNIGAVEITPAWSPGSDRVILSSTAGGNPDLWIQNALGTIAAKMPAPANTSAAEVNPVWSTDGKIAFHTTRSGSDEIWITDATGATATKLTDGASPSWLRDGKLVFVRFTGTSGSLYWLDPANPSVVHPINVGGGDAQHPSGVLP